MADYGGNFQISHDKILSERLYVMADTTQAGPSALGWGMEGARFWRISKPYFNQGQIGPTTLLLAPSPLASKIARPFYGSAKVMDFIEHN
jgi:hypothetical protein